MTIKFSIVRMSDLKRWRNPRPGSLVRKKDLARWENDIRKNAPFLFQVRPSPFVKRVTQLISTLRQKNPSVGPITRRSFGLAWEGHAGAFRKSGDPYIEHPVSAAEIVAKWGMGEEAAAALLQHDLPEDKKVTPEFLEAKLRVINEEAAKEVAHIIKGLTEFGKEPGFDREKPPSISEIYVKLLEYGEKVIICKLADRLHNMRTLEYVGEEVAQKKARETLNVYAKFADILGMWEVKRELEDLSWKYLEPELYQQIEAKREEIVKQSEKRVREIVRLIRANLDPSGKTIDVILEKRCIYELYERMQRRSISFEELNPSDIWRINIVVEKEEDCYSTWGRVHKLYPPVQTELRDQIAEQCSNGHQFLQSYVEIPIFGRLLIQIRDRGMQENYRLGVLSKPGEEEAYWRKTLLNYMKTDGDAEDRRLYGLVAAVSSPIMVYTRTGNRIQLPFGSTALEFARRINEDVFLHATQAIVNGRRAPLSQELNDGDSVFIETDQQSRPTLEWMDWMNWPGVQEAWESLFDYFKSHPQSQKSVIEYLDKKTSRYHLPFVELMKKNFFTFFIAEKGFKNEEDFVKKIGAGEADANELIKELRQRYIDETREQAGEIRKSRYMIIGEDRPGFEREIKDPLKKFGINLKFTSIGHNYVVEDEKGNKKTMARLILTVEGMSSGEAAGIQDLQIKTIIMKHPRVQQITKLTQEEVREIIKEEILEKDNF